MEDSDASSSTCGEPTDSAPAGSVDADAPTQTSLLPDGRKSFVLPKLTVTALRAPKHRKLPAILVTTSSAVESGADLIAPFNSCTASSPLRSSRRNRAVFFSDVCAAASGEASPFQEGQLVLKSTGGSDAAVPSNVTVEIPPVVIEVLETLSGDEDALSEVEDVLAILHHLAEQRSALGEDGYARGLKRLRALSEAGISFPIAVARDDNSYIPASSTQECLPAPNGNLNARQEHTRRVGSRRGDGGGLGAAAAHIASRTPRDGACVLLRDIIIIRLPRTVKELPPEERAHRQMTAQPTGLTAPPPNPRSDAATYGSPNDLHAVVLLEADRGLVAVHMVDLPLHSIPALASPCARAQENMLSFIRAQCPEAFHTIDKDVDGDDAIPLSAAQVLRRLKRPQDAVFPPQDEMYGVQPFSTLSPLFSEGTRAVTYEEIKARLSLTHGSGGEPPSPHRTLRGSSTSRSTTRTIAVKRTAVRGADREGRGTSTTQRTRLPSSPTRQPETVQTGMSRRRGPQARVPPTPTAAFDPLHPSDTSPFVQQGKMPLGYDAAGALVLHPL